MTITLTILASLAGLALLAWALACWACGIDRWPLAGVALAATLALAAGGCAQPGTVAPGAVAPGAVHILDGNTPQFQLAVKMAIASPEVHGEFTAMLTNHMQGTIQGTVHSEVVRQVQQATSQPITHTDAGDTGGNKTSVLANLNGGDWAIVVLILGYTGIKAIRDVYRIGRGVVRRARKP